jgi:DNA-binding transcriptional regulator YdaS (Cro superfamily)
MTNISDETISKLDAFGKVRLANLIGVSPAQINHWTSGFRPVPLQHCAAIELATNGVISRKDLCPDHWARNWPELLAISEGCKEVPAHG